MKKLKNKKSPYYLKWKKILQIYNHKLDKNIETDLEVFEYVNMVRLECEDCCNDIESELEREEEKGSLKWLE
jgi:hypothetical protein